MFQPSRSLLPTPSTAPPDSPGSSHALVTDSAEPPILVPNDLWTSSNQAAYGGGQPPAITHLERVEAEGRREPPAWAACSHHPGAFGRAARPAPGQQPLAAALGTSVLRHRDDVGGDKP